MEELRDLLKEKIKIMVSTIDEDSTVSQDIKVSKTVENLCLSLSCLCQIKEEK